MNSSIRQFLKWEITFEEYFGTKKLYVLVIEAIFNFQFQIVENFTSLVWPLLQFVLSLLIDLSPICDFVLLVGNTENKQIKFEDESNLKYLHSSVYSFHTYCHQLDKTIQSSFEWN